MESKDFRLNDYANLWLLQYELCTRLALRGETRNGSHQCYHIKGLLGKNEWSGIVFSSGINKIVQGRRGSVRIGLRSGVILIVF